MSPFLWIGMTLASLRELGKTPLLKDRLISWNNGIDNCFLKSLKILFGILLGPTALWSSIRFIRSCTSSGSIGEIKKEFYLWKFRKSLNLLSVFEIFRRSLSAIDVKNLVKWLARVLLLVTVLLSVVRLMFWSFLFLMLIIDLTPLHNLFAFFLLSSKNSFSSFLYRYWIMLLHGSCKLWIFFEFQFFHEDWWLCKTVCIFYF